VTIRKIPADQISPAAYNPRKDLQPGDPEYEKLLCSVDEFGYVEPIVWNERTGNIVGGHQRFKVLRQLGFTEIDCVVIDLDPEREKALNIALNKIMGEFDMKKLGDVLKELEEQRDLLELTGFDRPDIDKIMQERARERGEIVEDDFDADAEAAKITEPITRLGDVWLLGKHCLMCGDSTEISAVAQLMDGDKVKMCWTDPPWNVSYGDDSRHPSWKARQIMNDKMSTEDFGAFLSAAFKAMMSVCLPGAMVYIAMSSQEWGNLMISAKEAGLHWSSTIIWAKDRLVLSRKDYHTQYEPIYYGWYAPNGEPRLCPLEDRGQSDHWAFERPLKSPEHPTMKPIALVARAINNSSHAGDAVLDLFGGSGTTLLAAEQTDRISFMMELDPKYCDVICKRYIEHQKTDSGVFLLRDSQRTAYHEIA